VSPAQLREERAELRELLLGTDQPRSEAPELLGLLRLLDRAGELAHPPPDPQALPLELERERIAVGERMLHVREHAPGVGRAPVEQGANSVDKKPQVVHEVRQRLSAAAARCSWAARPILG
jgi:hypothetical protein